MSSNKIIIYVSPHLDDAIISSACHIFTKVNEGFRVIIITVFTDPGIKVDEKVKGHYSQRKSEDYDSAKILGAEVVHLNYVDAPYRKKNFVNFNTILFHDTLSKNDLPFVNEIADKLFSFFLYFNPLEIYFPLGVGGHIDHHIVFICSRFELMKKFKIYYYEDMPYGLIAEWIPIRWNNLKAKPLNFLTAQPAKKKLTDYKLPFVDNYCISLEDKRVSYKNFENEWKKAENIVNATIWMLNEGEIFKKKCLEVSVELFNIKCHAISKYSTEWPVLFGKDKKDIAEILSLNSRNEFCWSQL